MSQEPHRDKVSLEAPQEDVNSASVTREDIDIKADCDVRVEMTSIQLTVDI